MTDSKATTDEGGPIRHIYIYLPSHRGVFTPETFFDTPTLSPTGDVKSCYTYPDMVYMLFSDIGGYCCSLNY